MVLNWLIGSGFYRMGAGEERHMIRKCDGPRRVSFVDPSGAFGHA
ncbi:hypothetical protein DEV92_1146 [Phyllobacterium myrsinacearum]|nr:hypothetical protein DEV92_1146 [Phyllobacterium myrsinacearum]RZV07925.1 hypothetical protein EV654_2605 [Phyllobacterium myrsinacearum]